MPRRPTFQQWLKEFGGADKLARVLKVSPRVAHRWRRAEGWPKVETMLEIVKLSKGELTLEDVIATTWPVGKRGYRS